MAGTRLLSLCHGFRSFQQRPAKPSSPPPTKIHAKSRHCTKHMANVMIKLHRHTTYVQIERVRRFPPSNLRMCVRQRLQNQSVTLRLASSSDLKMKLKTKNKVTVDRGVSLESRCINNVKNSLWEQSHARDIVKCYVRARKLRMIVCVK